MYKSSSISESTVRADADVLMTPFRLAHLCRHRVAFSLSSCRSQSPPIRGSFLSLWSKTSYGSERQEFWILLTQNVAIPWPAVIQVKSPSFSFLGKKDIADFPSPCQGTRDERYEIGICKNRLTNPYSLRSGCTCLRAGMHSTFAVEESHVEVRPPLQSFLTEALLQRSTTAPYLHRFSGEHPPAVAFCSSSLLQKHYKMEVIRAQD